MTKNDFLGKVVIGNITRYILTDINGAYIEVEKEEENEYGTHSCYRYDTGTAPYDNAFAKGYLRFEDDSLNQPFIEFYEEYVKSSTGSFERFEEMFHRFS